MLFDCKVPILQGHTYVKFLILSECIEKNWKGNRNRAWKVYQSRTQLHSNIFFTSSFWGFPEGFPCVCCPSHPLFPRTGKDFPEEVFWLVSCFLCLFSLSHHHGPPLGTLPASRQCGVTRNTQGTDTEHRNCAGRTCCKRCAVLIV
jgi:hypothetical protein